MYDGLLLSKDGGIITDIKKSAYQGEPAIIIGLGGTGVDALKAVRKKVYENILPDDPAAAEPEYKHIKFLAVDTDCESFEGFAEDECLDIRVSNLNTKMDDDIKKKQAEFAWFQPGLSLSKGVNHAPSNIRQIGRYCVFKNIDQIIARVKSLKTDVTAGAVNSKVNVHIITGITGTTGGGTFIDMCYIVRDLMGENAILFGYFFMPDVNLNKQGIVGKPLTANRIKNNGYAALKELDYTMNLSKSGDSFSQYYGGASKYSVKETSAPLVDLCCLISSTGAPIPDGYMYSMEAVGEFILYHLDEDNSYVLRHFLSIAPAISRGKEHGAYCGYYTFGISTAELPTKEIGTYLAAKLYQKIGSGLTENVPIHNDVEKHAEKMGLTLSKIQDRLCGGVTGAGNIDWIGIHDFGIEDACNTTVSVTDNTIELNMPDVILEPIRNWKNENSGNLVKNFSALTKDLDDFKFMSKGTEADSLISSVFQYLQNKVVSDFRYGAVYASKLTYNTHDKSLNDYLDGLITFAEHTVSQWQSDLKLRTHDIENAVAECRKSCQHKLLRKKKQMEAIERYKSAVRAYYQTQLNIEVGEHIKEMLDILKKQINLDGYKNSLYPMYFKPMENMLTELKETFKSNLEFLHNTAVSNNVFVWKMVEFDEIKNHVDAQFAAQIGDEATEYRSFVKNIMEQQEEWIEGNRYKVEKMITSYIATEFYNFLSASMESYLNDKYDIKGDFKALQHEIETDLLVNGVLAKAEPKFYINPGLTIPYVTRQYLSVSPVESNIFTAAMNIAKKSLLNVRNMTAHENKKFADERIVAVEMKSGIPLYAYGLINELEREYNAGGQGVKGRHLYEITDRNRDINWANLQSLIPYSIKPDACADGKDLEQLYHEAVSKGVISENQSYPNYEYNIYELNKPEIKKKDDFIKNGRFDTKELKVYIAELKNYTDSNGRLNTGDDNNTCVKDVKQLLNDGCNTDGDDYREQCRIDYFIRFRGLQDIVKESMKILDDVDRALEEANNWIKEANNN